MEETVWSSAVALCWEAAVSAMQGWGQNPVRHRRRHYRNFNIHRRPIALGVGSITIGVVYAEGCPRRRCPSA
jgi:hypothetical protein